MLAPLLIRDTRATMTRSVLLTPSSARLGLLPSFAFPPLSPSPSPSPCRHRSSRSLPSVPTTPASLSPSGLGDYAGETTGEPAMPSPPSTIYTLSASSLSQSTSNSAAFLQHFHWSRSHHSQSTVSSLHISPSALLRRLSHPVSTVVDLFRLVVLSFRPAFEGDALLASEFQSHWVRRTVGVSRLGFTVFVVGLLTLSALELIADGTHLVLGEPNSSSSWGDAAMEDATACDGDRVGRGCAHIQLLLPLGLLSVAAAHSGVELGGDDHADHRCEYATGRQHAAVRGECDYHTGQHQLVLRWSAVPLGELHHSAHTAVLLPRRSDCRQGSRSQLLLPPRRRVSVR